GSRQAPCHGEELERRACRVHDRVREGHNRAARVGKHDALGDDRTELILGRAVPARPARLLLRVRLVVIAAETEDSREAAHASTLCSPMWSAQLPPGRECTAHEWLSRGSSEHLRELSQVVADDAAVAELDEEPVSGGALLGEERPRAEYPHADLP